MKTLTALVTALTVLGFAGAVSAQCSGMTQKPTVPPEDTAQTPVVILPTIDS